MLPASPNKNVSFVVVTYHTGPILFDMIASVLAQPEAKELVLVDNGNPDDVLSKLKELAAGEPRLRLMTGHGNVGFATATNMGARAIEGDYLFILNPDCVMPEGMLASFLAESAARAHPHMISCRVLDKDGVEQSGSRREQLTPWQALSEIFKVYRMFPDIPSLKRFNRHEDPVPEQTVIMPAISGAVMFFPKDDYWLIGGLDGDYFLHVEDLDLCLRFERAGGTIYFMPTPALTHIGGTSDTPKVKVEYWKTQSFQRYFFKNFTKEYPKPFLWLVVAAAWVRFGFFAASTYVRNFRARFRKSAPA